jgi:hypothetical protein
MVDTINEFVKISRELSQKYKNLDAITEMQEAEQIIKNYTGTLAHHKNREEMILERYNIAKQMIEYKQKYHQK